jgi:esterase/lipase superfamily enzyme
MPVSKHFLVGIFALLASGCMMPRPWLAPSPTEACAVGQAGREQLLVISFRVPDCQKTRFKWTAFRADRAQYSVADAARRTRLVDEHSWLKELGRQVTESRAAPVIYIHGFFNGQDDALNRALALRALLCPRRPLPANVIKCVPQRPVIALTWASHNRLAKYAWDEANNEWSLSRTVDAILTIARRHKGTTLVAHSMGNRILVAAAIAAPEKDKLFDRLVLASPDVDRAQVAELLRQDLGSYPVTIYASRKDQALSASWRTHGYPRAGDLSYWVSGRSPGYPYQKFNDADIVDTTDVRAGRIAHAAFVDSVEGAADLCHVLAGDPIKPGRDRYKLYPAYWMLRKGPQPNDDCAALARAAVLIANGKPLPKH